MAEKKQAERKLISFSNPAVKAALDKFANDETANNNASALVEALIADHFNVPFDENDPNQAERVAYLRDIQAAALTLEPAGTVAELEGLTLPDDSPSGINMGESSSIPAGLIPDQTQTEPDTTATIADDSFETIPEKPTPLSDDFTDLAGGEQEDTFTEAEPAPAVDPDPVAPENTETQTPAFVPVKKPDGSLNIPIKTPAKAVEKVEEATGLKTCPNCEREVLLDVCLNCGAEVK